MTIFGWDASHYDGPDVDSAVSDGIVFITHKAGGDATDSELDEWWTDAKKYPPERVLLGAYWVLYPGRPVERADAFLSRLDAVCSGWRNRPFILQVDCEEWGGNSSTVPSASDIRAFCDRLVAKMPKLRPIVYAPKWTYGEKLRGLPYPLWASSYGVNSTGHYRGLYPGDGSSRWGAYSGQTPAILQYGSRATIGNQTTCDANAFRGTLAELTALVAPGWVEDDMTPDDLLNTTVTNRATGKPVSIRALLEWRDAVEETTRNEIKAAVSALGSSVVAAVKALDAVDEAKLASALAPAVAAAVVAQLPAGSAPSREELEAALRSVLRSVPE